MTARSLIVVLLVLFGVLQYKLWISSNGIAQTIQLKNSIAQQMESNQKLIKRNQILSSQVSELQHGKATVVDLARDEIGMIKPGETYYQFVDPSH